MSQQPVKESPREQAIRAMQKAEKAFVDATDRVWSQGDRLAREGRDADRQISNLERSLSATNALAIKMFRVMAFVIFLEALLIGALSVIAYQALTKPERTSRALWFDREDAPSVQINADNEAIFLGTDSEQYAEQYHAPGCASVGGSHPTGGTVDLILNDLTEEERDLLLAAKEIIIRTRRDPVVASKHPPFGYLLETSVQHCTAGLGHAVLHVRQSAFWKPRDGEDHLVRAGCRLIMAFAVREGKG